MGSNVMERTATWKVAAAAALLLAAALVLSAPALASTSPVSGANVLSSTQVRLTFGAPLTSAEASALAVSISPSLAVQARSLADGGNSLVLTTAPQSNAVTYFVSVTAPGGASLGSALFIGTALGPVTTSIGHDDFNRPSGFLATDTPFGGSWYSARVDSGNSLGIVSSPALIGGFGDRALFSRVTNTSPDFDNASLYYKISGKEYYVSAYVYVPSGQNWGAGQAVGLFRLDQYYDTAHARLSAFAESPAGFSVRVDWKSTGNTYFSRLPGQGGVEPLVASGVSFDTWHWLQLHVKNSATTGAPGVVEAWIDGRLSYQQTSYYVHTTPMAYAEFGIMHMVTPGPAATTITDQMRLGTGYQQPSLGGQPPVTDTTPPSVSLTAPTDGATVPAAIPMAATAAERHRRPEGGLPRRRVRGGLGHVRAVRTGDARGRPGQPHAVRHRHRHVRQHGHKPGGHRDRGGITAPRPGADDRDRVTRTRSLESRDRSAVGDVLDQRGGKPLGQVLRHRQDERAAVHRRRRRGRLDDPPVGRSQQEPQAGACRTLRRARLLHGRERNKGGAVSGSGHLHAGPVADRIRGSRVVQPRAGGCAGVSFTGVLVGGGGRS